MNTAEPTAAPTNTSSPGLTPTTGRAANADVEGVRTVRNNDFHLALIARCESRWLMRLYELLYDQHRRYRVIARAERGDRDIHAEHEAMLEAALARDTDALLAAHETHIRNTVGTLRRQLRFDQGAQ